MKALFLGSDPTLFVPDSAAFTRMLTYAEKIGELHIVSGAARNEVVEHVRGNGKLVLHGIRAPKLLLPYLLSKRARALIIERGIEIVSSQDPFEHGWSACMSVRGTNAKLHIQVHTDFLSPWYVHGKIFRGPNIPVPLLNKIRRHMAGLVLPYADGIRAVSSRVKESLIEKYGDSIPEPSILPIAVSSETPQPVALPAHQFTFALLAAGRLEPEKRIEDILYAIARLVGEYPSLGLFIVGSGRERSKLERTAKGLGISDRVVFLGERGKDAPGLMASAQAFIQASAYEGYGRTLVEAALAKVPIITTDVGIVGEVFTGYVDVLSAPVGDPAALATHIAGLIEDSQTRASLVLNAERAVREHLAFFADLPALMVEDLQKVVEDAV